LELQCCQRCKGKIPQYTHSINFTESQLKRIIGFVPWKPFSETRETQKTPVTKMLKFATKNHKNFTVSSGVSTEICDKNISLRQRKFTQKTASFGWNKYVAITFISQQSGFHNHHSCETSLSLILKQ
jgi:hypothetical protein